VLYFFRPVGCEHIRLQSIVPKPRRHLGFSSGGFAAPVGESTALAKLHSPGKPELKMVVLGKRDEHASKEKRS